MKRLKLKQVTLTFPDGSAIHMNDLLLPRNGSSGCYRLEIPDTLIPVQTVPTVETFSNMPESTHMIRLTKVFGDTEWLKYTLFNDALKESYNIDETEMKILRAYLSGNDYIVFNKFYRGGASWKKGKRWPVSAPATT